MIIFKNKNLLIGGVILILILLGGYFYWQKNINLDPNFSKAYYKIFNKEEILSGNEDNATIVVQKLDKRLKKYHKTFAKMAGTTDEKKLKALFYMNFVHMYGFYGERTLTQKTFKELLWDSENFHCLTNTIFLEMLLDKAGGYEFRTVGISGRGDHGYVEVKFDNQWQIHDPTVNIWIDKSTEELLTGVPRNTKRFFLKAGDQFNEKADRDNVVDLKDLMVRIGKAYKPTLSKYDCCFNLSEYQY